MRTLTPLLTLALVGALASAAHADVPPPDTCDVAGEACNTAGDTYDQPGTCEASTCTRASPAGPVTYDCSRCVARTTAEDAAATTDSPTTSEPKRAKGGSGCALGPSRFAPRGAALLLAMAALGLTRRRRG